MSMYQKMKAKGIDMSWYEKHKSLKEKEGIIPLSDEECDKSAIYYLDSKGRLFTLDGEGNKYKQVRQIKQAVEDCYMCMHCRKDFKTFNEALEHAEG